MAVETTGTSANFIGTGVSSSYAPGFYVNTSGQVKVYVAGVLKTLGDDYVVNGVGDAVGCTVVGNFTSGAAVYIERVTPITQLVDTQNNETILEDVLDAEFDKLTMIAQELDGSVGRAVLVPKGEQGGTLPSAAVRAGYLLGFDAEGALALATPGATTSDLGATLAASSGSALVGFLQAGAGAVPRTAQAKMRDALHASDFGVVANGVTNDAPAMALFIAALKAKGGGLGLLPQGIIAVASEVLVDGDGIYLVGQGPGGPSGVGTRFLALTNGMNMLRIAASDCGLMQVGFDGGTTTGSTSGLKLCPADESQTTTLTFTNYNAIENIRFENLADSIIMRCGPKVGGADSGCWYNRIGNITVLNCDRTVWLRGATTPTGSNVNRNVFYAIRGGSTGGGRGNTGIQLDSGDTNVFYSCAFEGIALGTSPNATPTAIKVALSSTGGDNNDNAFIGCRFEANTRDLELDNPRTTFIDHTMTGSKMLLNVLPRLCLGNDPSIAPQIALGMTLQNGSYAPGVPLDTAYVTAANGLSAVRTRLRTNAATISTRQESSFLNAIAAGGSINPVFGAIDLAQPGAFAGLLTVRVTQATGVEVLAQWRVFLKWAGGGAVTHSRSVKVFEESATGVGAGASGGVTLTLGTPTISGSNAIANLASTVAVSHGEFQFQLQTSGF